MATTFLPDLTSIGISPTVLMILMIVFFILVAIVVGVIIYMVLMHFKYNKKIVVFSKVGKTIEVVKKDTAMIIKVGETGDTVFLTRKTKKYLPSPMIQTGRNTYWFYQREDDEWINFGIEDIDDKMRTLKAHFLDKEMRYARVALQKNFSQRYQKVTWWEKYGGLVAYVLLIAVSGIMIYLLFDKYLDLAERVNQTVELGNQVLEETRKLLVALDNYRGGGGLTA